jgi:ABC-type dipeptide/oligopeptide/nickel transport system permease subunit
MLSSTVMRVIQVFPSSWYWVWLVLLSSVSLPSVVMWGDRGEDRCCNLSKVGMVQTVGFCQVMWIVMLESAKDQILGVDTPGQQVSSRVWYGTTCLLIMGVVGSVACTDEWIGVVTRTGSHGARGIVVLWLPRETLTMLWYCVLP